MTLEDLHDAMKGSDFNIVRGILPFSVNSSVTSEQVPPHRKHSVGSEGSSRQLVFLSSDKVWLDSHSYKNSHVSAYLRSQFRTMCGSITAAIWDR